MNRIINLVTLTIGLVLVSLNLNAQPQSLEKRIERLERITDNPVLLQLSRKLGQQQSEIQQLYDQVDRLQHKLNLMETKQNNRYKEADERLNKLEVKTVLNLETTVIKDSKDTEKKTLDKKVEQPVKKSKEVEKIIVSNPVIIKKILKEKTQVLEVEPIQPIKIRPATKVEKKEYKAAFSLMKNKKYEKARLAFVSFKNAHPTSSLASNSLYWAGEASLVLNKEELGLGYFLDVIKLYAKSYKASDAMLRAADTFRKLKKFKQAKAKYKQVKKDYPNSKAAKKSRKRLMELNRLAN